MYRQLLNTYLSHSEQLSKNKKAPEGKKWCNFLCQDYVPTESFYSNDDDSKKPRVTGFCIECSKKNIMCKNYIKLGKITKEQFKENPNIINEINSKPVIEDILECVECKEEKTLDKFDHKRNTCKECRKKQMDERTEKDFEKNIEELDQYKNNPNNLRFYLLRVPANKLQKLMKYYNIGRHKNDKKEDMIVKIISYFKAQQNPHLCLGNCGFILSEQFSYCEACKVKPKITVEEKNLKFKENLPEFMENIYELTEEDEHKHNLYCIYAICEYLEMKGTKNKNKTKRYYIELINEKLKEKREQHEKELKNSMKPNNELCLNGIMILAREDGYINATQMCKAGNKLFGNWYKLDSTKELIETLESISNPDITFRISAVDIKKGGNDKTNQGSWIHPDLAVQLAQWLSPVFALQVSRWVRELSSTGTVSILRGELLTKEKQLKQLSVKHENIKKKRNYHKFKQGPCFYIISDIESGCLKYKGGIEEVDVNVRMATHRSTTPGVKIEYLCYTDKCVLIEEAILQKYEKNRKYLNHEWIYDVDIKDIIVSVKTLINFLELKVEVEEDVSKYNNQIEID